VSELTSELRRMADDAARQARPPAAADIIRQGDRRRRRSLTHQSLGALSAAGIAGAGVALGVGLTASSTPAHATHGTGTIQTAAFTLVKHANGTATLTPSCRVTSPKSASRPRSHRAASAPPPRPRPVSSTSYRSRRAGPMSRRP
jgi:hypothetical protein